MILNIIPLADVEWTAEQKEQWDKLPVEERFKIRAVAQKFNRIISDSWAGWDRMIDIVENKFYYDTSIQHDVKGAILLDLDILGYTSGWWVEVYTWEDYLEEDKWQFGFGGDEDYVLVASKNTPVGVLTKFETAHVRPSDWHELEDTFIMVMAHA